MLACARCESREGVVDVEIAVGRDAARECEIVRLLARPEADIVEQADVTGAQDAERLLDHRPADLGNEHDLAVDHSLYIALHHASAHGRIALALRATEMREQQHLGAAVGEFEDGRLDRLDPRHVAGAPFDHRQVEIDADQCNLAGEVGGKIVEGLELAHSILRSP